MADEYFLVYKIVKFTRRMDVWELEPQSLSEEQAIPRILRSYVETS